LSERKKDESSSLTLNYNLFRKAQAVFSKRVAKKFRRWRRATARGGREKSDRVMSLPERGNGVLEEKILLKGWS